MDIKDYKYRSVFVSQAAIHAPSEDEVKVAKASLDGLKQLLPANIDPADDPDLLYISGDGALGGFVNKNCDGISRETAVAIHKTARNKFIDIEHCREDIVGVVLYPALTTIDTHEILTDEQALASDKPFNLSFAGVLWKVLAPMLAKYIGQQGASTGKDVLSLSWEIAFSNYSIAVGEKEISKARLIKADDPSFAIYDKMLTGNGGTGKDAKGEPIYRVIEGDAIILGYGVVSNPAAEVKGILPIQQSAALASINEILKLTDEKLKDFGQALFRAAVERGITFEAAAQTITPQKSEEKNITPSNASVTLNNVKSMKIETVEQLKAALGQHESTAAVVDLVESIKKGSEQYAKDLKAQEDIVKNAEAAKVESDKTIKELKASLEKLNKELAEVRASQEATEAGQKFQERMAFFDEKFELDDEDRKLITDDIREMDDATFAAYSKKQEKLMCGKFKKSKKDDKEQAEKNKKLEEEAAQAAKAAADAKAAFASVEAEKAAKLPNGIVETDQDLDAKMKAAFGGSIKIDGKTLDERNAAKAKK